MSAQELPSPTPYRKMPAWLNVRQRKLVGALAVDDEWVPGRQETGYKKLDIVDKAGARWVIQRALNIIGRPPDFDAWLLHYPKGSEITPHTDPAYEGKCHVRLNAIVIAGLGGALYLDDTELPLARGDAYVFRPDITEHHVAPIESGSRLVLSVGANIEPEQARALGLA
jgi:hypothetical protein